MATFIKLGSKAAVALVLAAAVIAWALIAPESLQATVNAVLETVGESLPGVIW